jgi:hypothetical protein
MEHIKLMSPPNARLMQINVQADARGTGSQTRQSCKLTSRLMSTRDRHIPLSAEVFGQPSTLSAAVEQSLDQHYAEEDYDGRDK